MSIQVKELNDTDVARWDAYVEGAADATFFHLAGWKQVLERAFGHKTHFLYAEVDGEIAGVLPLAQVKSLLFGNSLSSLPFCVYGGIVAQSQDVTEALRERGCELAKTLKVDALEMRNRASSEAGWPVKELYYTFRKTIHADDDVNLKAIPNRQRAMVRKGIKEGLESAWDDSSKRLYRVYSESVRNLGTPVFSSKYFQVLQDVFKEKCSILMITHQGQDIAGVLNFHFRDEILPYYGGSTAAARTVKGVNHFMYWELIRRSAEQGSRLFDFGRSKAGTGPFSFKKNFGFEPQPLPYDYFLVESDAIPDVNPLNPKYQLMINVWSRLPLPIANLLGPPLAKDLG